MSSLTDRARHWLDHTDGAESIETSITFDLIKSMADRIEELEATLAARDAAIWTKPPYAKAEGRIEELEAALREISKGKHVDLFGFILDQPSREAQIALRALGES